MEKAFLSDQCNEIEENNRIKSEIPKKISCKNGLNKGQKCMDLTEAEYIKKWWQEYTEELYKRRS